MSRDCKKRMRVWLHGLGKVSTDITEILEERAEEDDVMYLSLAGDRRLYSPALMTQLSNIGGLFCHSEEMTWPFDLLGIGGLLSHAIPFLYTV